jgi:hypothetical protein
MARQKHNKEEQEKIKRYHDTFEAKEKLHKLMKRVIFATDYGEEDDDYTKAVHLKIGNGTLSYDPYYQKLTYYDNNYNEYGIEEDDLETVQNLIKEVERRFKAFENGIKGIRTKAVKELFDKPIDKILNQ